MNRIPARAEPVGGGRRYKGVDFTLDLPAGRRLAEQRAIVPGDLLRHTPGTPIRHDPAHDPEHRWLRLHQGQAEVRSNHYGVLLQLMPESDAIVSGAAHIREVRTGNLVQLDIRPFLSRSP